jgi:AmiR/NasT family two-component response regulator
MSAAIEPVRVLIVEDDFLVAQMVRGQLAQIGYEVAGHAVDGAQAVELIHKARPDVVLLDIKLLTLDGLEVARRIQSRCPTPVVMLTAHAGMDLVREASMAGVGAYLVKPPNAREIERAITIARARFADLMELRRMNAELEAALAQVKTLSGLLPICAACKKIRDDHGYWHEVEAYVRAHTEAEFTHGICPDCMRKLYPDYVRRGE